MYVSAKDIHISNGWMATLYSQGFTHTLIEHVVMIIRVHKSYIYMCVCVCVCLYICVCMRVFITDVLQSTVFASQRSATGCRRVSTLVY